MHRYGLPIRMGKYFRSQHVHLIEEQIIKAHHDTLITWYVSTVFLTFNIKQMILVPLMDTSGNDSNHQLSVRGEVLQFTWFLVLELQRLLIRMTSANH